MRKGIPSEVVRRFKAVPLFQSVSPSGIRSLVTAATEVDVPAGKVVVREGEVGRHLYVILSGEMTVSRRGRRIATLGPGDFFGELAFLDGAPRTATVAAYTEVRMMVLGPRELDVIIRREPAIVRHLLQAVAARARRGERPAVTD